MADDTAVVDDGLEAGLDTEISPEGAEPQEGVDPTAETGEPEGDPNKAAPIAEIPAIVAGKLSEAAKAHLEKLKVENPTLAKQLKQALYQHEAFSRAIPGGLKEVQQLQQTIEQAGGVEGLKRTGEELAYFNDLDKAFTAGDPKFIQAMTETPEGQRAFVQLAPSMFQKLGELHPESYSSLVAQAMVADLYSNRIPLDMERLQDLVGDNPKAVEILGRITGYLNRVNEWAKKPVNLPAKPAASPDRETQLQERELNITRSEWRGEADKSAKTVFDTEYGKLTAGRKLTDVQKSAVVELYQGRVQKLVGGVPNFVETAKRFFENGNKDGYLRHVNAVYAKVIPAALKQAMDTIVPARPGPKPGITPSVKPAAKPGTPEQGFTWTANRPDPLTIDPRFTNTDMIQAGKAVLKNGTRVQWRR